MANDITLNELATTVDELARMTQEQFSSIDGRFTAVQSNISELKNDMKELKTGLKQVLEILVDAPSPKVTDQLSHKVDDHEERLAVVERKLQPIA